jgi:pimeloyl-ACP methyl ester carboxylesterase
VWKIGLRTAISNALSPVCRTILVHARGHRQSEKRHDAPAYVLSHRVGDIVAVPDAIGIERAHFWGNSMGGLYGFGMATYAPQRLNRLIIDGQSPFARDQTRLRRMVSEGMHGSDLLAPEGAPVAAAAPGRTIRIQESGPADLEIAMLMRAPSGVYNLFGMISPAFV